VAFDTGPLIYYIEEHPDHLSTADELFGAFDTGAARGMTSVLTLQEVLVKPLREGREDIARKYRQVLSYSANVRLYDRSTFLLLLLETGKGLYPFLS
jgi:predicted nucleic acid-binding protein